MLNIDKEKLKASYLEGNLEYFFEQAYKITDFLLSSKYSVKDKDKRADEVQDCMLNLLTKHQKGKIDKDSTNMMAFIWSNSNFRKLEMLKTEKRRNKIAPMISYDIEENIHFLSIGSRYGQIEIDRIIEKEDNTDKKYCSCCGVFRKLREFSKHHRTPDGLTHKCKYCIKKGKKRQCC